MQQRQPRLGDVLDDYCPRERRVTNHAIVAMIGPDVKQTRCTTCDTEHEYKHAKVPRQRRKSDSPAALFAQVVAGAPKVVAAPQVAASVRADEHADDLEVEDASAPSDEGKQEHDEHADDPEVQTDLAPEDDRVTGAAGSDDTEEGDPEDRKDDEAQPAGLDEGPVHRRLIRASLPRIEGQAPPARPNPEFTIRQPNNSRQNRFRPRHGGPGRGRCSQYPDGRGAEADAARGQIDRLLR